MDFQPVKKVQEPNQQSFKPARKVSGAGGSFQTDTTEEVPEWGRKSPTLYGMAGAGKELFDYIVKPAAEGTGLALGMLAGTPAGPVGTVAGGGLGYAIAKKATDHIQRNLGRLVGEKIEEPTLAQEAVGSAQDVATGATMEMGGQAIGKALPAAVGVIGKAASQIMGKLTGTGGQAIKEAFKSGAKAGIKGNPLANKTMFDKALRGKMTGEEVVGVARNALNRIKDIRARKYQNQLAKITGEGTELPAVPGQASPVGRPITDGKPIADELKRLMSQYNIKIKTNPDGTRVLDATRAAMGRKGVRDIKNVIQTVGRWGRDPEDFTAKGLDTLKRQLDDFYSDSSQARGFVASIRSKVKNTITEAVPEYGKMTENYARTTQLIKDIESNLMMRKQGMSGRIVSDQTLRRLMSAMKDNFELRKELVGMLSTQGGEDVMGAVAGYSMRTFVPRGLAGTGPALIGNVALAKMVNPAFWPVVASSSPRVSAEFLRLLGKYTVQLAEGTVPASKALSYKGVSALGELTGGTQGKLQSRSANTPMKSKTNMRTNKVSIKR